MSSPDHEPVAEPAWVVTDGAAGNERQALALARAMGLNPRVFRVRPSPPWSWFAPRWRWGVALAVGRELRAALAERAPRLVIGCGRAASLITAWLKREHGVYAIQILDPRADVEQWDVIIMPRHDGGLAYPHVLHTLGAINDITPESLRAAGAMWSRLAELPSPRTAVLIGGSTAAQTIDEAWCDHLLAHLAQWQAREPGAFLVTTSRRTAPRVVARLRAAFAQWPGLFWAPGDAGDNPYPGLLAQAQRIVVSPDSVNLMSEACATELPVFIAASRPVTGKLARFHAELTRLDRARPLGDAPATWRVRPIQELPVLAAVVLDRYQRNR